MSTGDTFQVCLLRYRDLVAAGIISNRMTLKRWSDLSRTDPFPAPLKLGPNSIAWNARSVEEWLRRRGGDAQ